MNLYQVHWKNTGGTVFIVASSLPRALEILGEEAPSVRSIEAIGSIYRVEK